VTVIQEHKYQTWTLRAERYRVVSFKLSRTGPKSGIAAFVVSIRVGVSASVLCTRSARGLTLDNRNSLK